MLKRTLFILLLGALAACSTDLDGPTEIPELLETQGVSGQFVASCDVTHRLKDDPIVKPGQPGAAHSHDFFGSDSADAFSTLESLRAGTSSCPDRPGDTAAYWVPTLYSGGEAVTPRRIRVYYRNGGKDPATIQPYPAGLKIIAGDHMASASKKQDTDISSWACTIKGDEREVQDVPRCSGSSLRLRIVFPDCWDGRRLDSPDHKSHMMYSARGECPSGWVPVPQMTMGIRYWYKDGLSRDPAQVSLASGSPYTGHADFFNSWDQANLTALVEECINAARNCGDAGGPKPRAGGSSGSTAPSQSTPSQPEPVSDALLVSTSSDRGDAELLDGASVRRRAYVFWNDRTGERPRRVQFYVDGKYVRSDTSAPFDLGSGSSRTRAKSFSFSSGEREVRWVATYAGSRQEEGVVRFRAR